MNYLKEENSALKVADSEELDYEEDDVYTKKSSPVTFDKEQVVEDGEILDEEDGDDNFICSFYQSGKCLAGDKCPFMHVTDKGLYSMFDAPSIPEFQTVHACSGMWEETASSAWDRALLEAKKLVKENKLKRKKTSDPVIITIESDDEPKATRAIPRRYRSPEALSCKASLSNSSDSSKRKSVKNRYRWCREVMWHHPRRRSPVGYSKSSSKFRRRTSSSSSSTEVWFKKQKRRRKKMATDRHNVKSFSTPVSTGEKKIKKDAKEVEQKKKSTPSVHKELDKSPKIIFKEKSSVILDTYDSKNDTKVPCTRQEKKIPPFNDDISLKPTLKLVKKNLPTFNHQLNVTSKWTPKKINPPTPQHSCSDMSISPLSNSSLSDIFSPDMQTDEMDRALPCTFSAQTKAYGPVVSPVKEDVGLFQREYSVTQNDRLEKSTEVKPQVTSSNSTTVNKTKTVKKRNFDHLENDLLKFQPDLRFRQSWSVSEKNVQPEKIMQSNLSKSREALESCMPKKDNLLESQKVEKTPLTRRLTRKEVLLKHLEVVNAAIERKKRKL